MHILWRSLTHSDMMIRSFAGIPGYRFWDCSNVCRYCDQLVGGLSVFPVVFVHPHYHSTILGPLETIVATGRWQPEMKGPDTRHI